MSPAGSPPPRLLDRVRQALQTIHRSRHTQKAYVGWIRRYIVFHGKRHPTEMGAKEVTQFLTSLAVQRHVAASTQNQALAALLFLYRVVLEQNLPWLDDLVRARRPEHLPVVLTRDEVRAVLQHLTGVPHLLALLYYGAGLRLLEGARLRAQDVDFGANLIVVRNGKGAKDRVTMLPAVVKEDLRLHLEGVQRQHQRDLGRGAGWVELPDALGRKYPNAGREWGWQWVFPATRFYLHRETRQRRRHHLHETVIQRAVKEAVRCAGLVKHATPPHLPALVRDPPAGGRLRHPHRAGPAGPPRRRHHDDLHARPQPGPGGGAEPGGPDAGDVGRTDGSWGLRRRCRVTSADAVSGGRGKATGPQSRATTIERGQGRGPAPGALPGAARSMRGATQFRRIESSTYKWVTRS